MKPDRLLLELVSFAWGLLSVVLSYVSVPFLIWHGLRKRLRRYRIVEVTTA